jgi:hypothetical protein
MRQPRINGTSLRAADTSRTRVRRMGWQGVQTAKDGKNSGSKTDKAPKQKRTRRFCSYSLHKINENKKEMNRTTKL